MSEEIGSKCVNPACGYRTPKLLDECPRCGQVLVEDSKPDKSEE